MMKPMGAPSRRVAAHTMCALLAVTALLVQAAITVDAASSSAPADNVAVQWNALASRIVCSSGGVTVFGSGLALPHLHLAQWHALLALKGTGGCTTPEAVVAYASHKVLTTYFPTWKDFGLDGLLTDQINAMGWTESQRRLAKRLGVAVALDLVGKNLDAREYAIKEIKDDLTAHLPGLHTPSGLFSYHNSSRAGQEAQPFATYVNARTFVVPNALQYIQGELRDLRPPAVPSDAWDKEYNDLIDIGRRDWPGRTADINHTAAIYGCLVSGHCAIEENAFRIARMVLPRETSLYDTVELFAKLVVATYDATVVCFNMKWGYTFWRPILAFRRGDARHEPRPSWMPFVDNPYHPDYPSGSACATSAAMTVLQNFFGDKQVAFSLDRGMVLSWCPNLPVGTQLGYSHYNSFRDVVTELMMSRMYAGAHWNISVTDGARAGARVAQYVERNWGRPKNTPYGVLPSGFYLDVTARQPDKAGQFRPVTLVV